MEDAKKLSEDVAKSTGEFMLIFTEKYISSTVGNKLQDRIKTTLTQGVKESKSDNKDDNKPEQESEQEPKNKKDDDNKEQEENKKDNAESTEKDTENKSNEQPKEQDAISDDKKDINPPDDAPKQDEKPADDAKDKPDDQQVAENTEAPDVKKVDNPDDKNAQKQENIDKNDDTDVKNDNPDVKDAEKQDTKDEDTKDDSKDDKKAEKAQNESEEYTNYRPSVSTGIYGFYNLKNVKAEEKKEIEDDIKEAVSVPVTFPMIGSIVNSYKKGLIDGGGNEYNAFNILYYKLSINDNDSCRFGTKLARYSRIRDYHELMTKMAKGKTNIKNLKFPSKSYAFWKKNDKEFLDSREKELNKYFMDSGTHKYIAQNDTFQIFLGLKQDGERVNKMKVFNKSLAGTCNKMEYIRSPTNYELNRFDTEQDMLLYSIMIDVKDKTKNNIKDIIDKQPEKLKSTMTNKINKLLATTVQKGVNESWKGIEDTRKNVSERLDNVLENNGEIFDKNICDLIGKIRPIIEKKLGKKEDDDDEKEDTKEEEKKDELLIGEIKSLNEFINKLTEESENGSLNKLLDEYRNSYEILNNKEKKGVIAKYLYEMYEFEYGEYIKKMLSKTYLNLESYKKYEKDTELICNASAELIQLSFEIFVNNLLLVFEAIDNNEKNINKLLTGIGENIANIIGECDKEIVKELRTVESNALELIVDAIGNLSGIFGNLLCCIINDCCNDNEMGLKECLINNLNKYIKMFVECVLNALYKSVLCVLVTLVKHEIKEDMDKLLGDKLEFDWIPKGLPESIPKDVLESVINIIVAYLLEKNMKKKRNALNSKIYQTIRSN